MRKLSETLRKSKIYVLEQKMTLKDLAKKIGIDYNHLHLILSCKKKTTLSMAKKIQEATDGKLVVGDFVISSRKSVEKCPTCGGRIKSAEVHI